MTEGRVTVECGRLGVTFDRFGEASGNPGVSGGRKAAWERWFGLVNEFNEAGRRFGVLPVVVEFDEWCETQQSRRNWRSTDLIMRPAYLLPSLSSSTTSPSSAFTLPLSPRSWLSKRSRSFTA